MALVSAAAPAKNAPLRRQDDRDRVPVEIERDQWGRPLIVQSDGSKVGYTRASGLGKVLEDDTNITKWKLRVLLWGAARRKDLILAAQAIAGHTERHEKKELDELAALALDTGGSGDKARIGTALHALTERVDRGEPIPDVGTHQLALNAYRDLMRPWFRVVASEVFIVHDALQTAGTFDRVVELLVWMQPCDSRGRAVGEPLPPGTRLVLDLKTSGTSDYFGIAFAVQLAVYQAGQVYDAATGTRVPWSAPTNDRWALILHVPSGGNSAELHWVDLVAGRELAELAVRVKRERSASKSLISRAAIEPWVPDELVLSKDDPPGFAATVFERPDLRPATPALGPSLQAAHAHRRLLDRIASATSDAAMRELWAQDQAGRSPAWSHEHTEAVGARLAELGERVTA